MDVIRRRVHAISVTKEIVLHGDAPPESVVPPELEQRIVFPCCTGAMLCRAKNHWWQQRARAHGWHHPAYSHVKDTVCYICHLDFNPHTAH
eukprot:5405783-Karenia_brevis.AAC.1